jgi:hypothetical protein
MSRTIPCNKKNNTFSGRRKETEIALIVGIGIGTQ